MCVREFLHCGVTLILVLLLNRTQDLKKKKKLSQSSFVYPFFGEGNGNPLQYSCLENSTGRGAWWATIRGVAKGQTWLSTAATHSLVKSSDVFTSHLWQAHMCLSILEMSKMNKKVTNALEVYNLLLPALLSQSFESTVFTIFWGPSCF